MKRSANEELLRCSFCQKTQEVVGKLISSRGDQPRVYICDDCVAACNGLLEKAEPGERVIANQMRLPRPAEVNDFLDQ